MRSHQAWPHRADWDRGGGGVLRRDEGTSCMACLPTRWRRRRRPPGPRARRSPSAASRSSRAARSGRSRSRPTASSSSPSTRPTTGSRSSRSTSRRPAPTRPRCRSGLEPVAVAARSNAEVWVVNHLSDSVSIVDVDAAGTAARRARRCSSATSRATSCSPGPDGTRAFITTAHRGQNTAVDPQLTTPGVGRADVWVFDANDLGRLARRHAAHHRHPVHRHAARARGHAGRLARSTRPRSTPATDHRRQRAPRHRRRRARRPARRPTPTARAMPAPRGRVVSRSSHNGQPLGRRARPPLGRPGQVLLPDKDVFAIDATANPPVAAPAPAASTPASAPSSSTWRSTR